MNMKEEGMQVQQEQMEEKRLVSSHTLRVALTSLNKRLSGHMDVYYRALGELHSPTVKTPEEVAHLTEDVDDEKKRIARVEKAIAEIESVLDQPK